MSQPTRRRLLTALLGAALVATPVTPAHATPHSAIVSQAPLPPDRDPFLRPPDDYSTRAPGTILRSRPAVLAAFGVIQQKGVWARQILYRSNDAHGRPLSTAALVLVPKIPAKTAPRPLVAFQSAEDSLALKCAPSYQLQAGVPNDNLVTQAEILEINGLLMNGWAVVVPDHEGPRSAYAAGPLAGRAVLDGLRAALDFDEAALGDPRTPVAMWGYSGGAIATGWAAELQPSYAPELNLVGVAEGGVPADLEAAFKQLNGGPFGGFALAGALGVGRAYPELGTYLQDKLTAEGRELAQHLGDSCNISIVLQGLFKDIDNLTTIKDPLGQAVPQKVLTANRMGQGRPSAPMFIYHSVNDQLVPVKSVDTLVRAYCADGVSVAYHRDTLSEHAVLVGTGAPLALSWLQERFAGKPAPKGCTTTDHVSMLTHPDAISTAVRYLTGIRPLFSDTN